MSTGTRTDHAALFAILSSLADNNSLSGGVMLTGLMAHPPWKLLSLPPL